MGERGGNSCIIDYGIESAAARCICSDALGGLVAWVPQREVEATGTKRLVLSRVEEGKGDDGEARRASRVDPPPDFFFTMGPRFSAGERFRLSHAGKGARSEGRGGEVVVQVWWVCSHPCVSLWAQILCKRGGVREWRKLWRVVVVVGGGMRLRVA